MKPRTFHVRPRHFRAARPGSVRQNPVALALTEATGITCYANAVSVQAPGRFHAAPPRWLTGLLDGFDGFGACEPFALTLTGEPGAYRILPAVYEAENEDEELTA